MVGETDDKDKNESRKIAIVLILLVVALMAAAALMLPLAGEIVAVHLSPGLGLRDSAILSFFITIVVMIVFAIAAGDGLLGELQFILAGFLLFFIIIWLMLAWVF